MHPPECENAPYRLVWGFEHPNGHGIPRGLPSSYMRLYMKFPFFGDLGVTRNRMILCHEIGGGGNRVVSTVHLGIIPQNIWHQAPGNQFVTGSVDVAVDDKVGFLGKVVLERYDSDQSIIFEMLAQ